jgi:hypothetical protein
MPSDEAIRADLRERLSRANGCETVRRRLPLACRRDTLRQCHAMIALTTQDETRTACPRRAR